MNEVSALDLDRQAIAKTDFPTSRRGYEREAVEAHLDAVATEAERLQQELARTAAGAQPLSAAAAEQVQLIVEAAEHSASEILQVAEEQSARVCADADAEAERVREESVERGREHVARVAEATAGLLERVEAMQGELGVLFESLRAGGRRLTADVALLDEQLGELHGAPSAKEVTQRGADDPPAVAVAGPEMSELPSGSAVAALAPNGGGTPEPEAAAVRRGGSVEVVGLGEPEPVVPVRAPAAVSSERGGGDVEGARLTALNMALDGQTRKETDEYLSANFELDDRAALLAEVYATVAE